MKEYTLTELLNATCGEFENIKFQLECLKECAIAKDAYKNLHFTIRFTQVGNQVYVEWDNNVVLKNILAFCKRNNIISDLPELSEPINYNNLQYGYKQFTIVNQEKWNIYYNMLLENNIIKNMPINYSSESTSYTDDNKTKGYHNDKDIIISPSGINAKNSIYLIGDIKRFELESQLEFIYNCNNLNPIIFSSYNKNGQADISIDKFNDFLHEIKIPTNKLNPYILQKLDENNGMEFDLYRRLENEQLYQNDDSTCKTLKYTLKN